MGSKRRDWVRVSVAESVVESLCAAESTELFSSDIFKSTMAPERGQNVVMKHEQLERDSSSAVVKAGERRC